MKKVSISSSKTKKLKSHITHHKSNNSGITLVALIITVIVLLILAVVAIRAVQGDGILQHAKNAKETYSESEEDEKIKLASSEAFLAGKGSINKENLTTALNSQFNDDWMFLKETEEYFKIKIKSTERMYKIYTNGSNERDDIIEISDSSYFTYSGSSITGLSTTGKTELTALAGKSVKLIIPETYNDTKIDTIGKDTFYNNKSILNNLSTLIIEASNATSLGNYCFSGCTSLTNVSLLEVISLGDYCFSGCTSLTNVSLPNLISLGNYCFSGCTSLTNVSLLEVISLGNYCFSGCTSLTNVSLLEVISLGEKCFYGCTSLKNVEIPKATSLEKMCFYGCTSLTNISIPNVTSLGKQCFDHCTSLITINMPKVETMGLYAFSSCGFNKIELPATLETTGSSIFLNCSNLTDIYIQGRTKAPDGWATGWNGSSATVHWNESMPNE